MPSYSPVLCYFYPRSPCGERQQVKVLKVTAHSISIHALLAESDPCHLQTSNHPHISIHALLAESDARRPGQTAKANRNFYPRSPCGERPPLTMWSTTITTNFYPRSPCGERLDRAPPLTSRTNFYPRSPCGERHRNIRNS